MSDSSVLSRRRLLRLGLALPAPLVLAACGGSGSGATPTSTASRSLDAPASSTVSSGQAATSPTATSAAVACTGVATPSQTEGPYFKAGSPQRTSLLESGMAGTRLTLTGSVLDRGCQPVANAKVDFWQADAQGNYDNSGYRLRGHQFTGAQGGYSLETVIPGLYPGRTEHIHVKVTPPSGATVTSQLYFPGVEQNQRDGIFDAALLIDLKDGADGGKTGRFDFVVDV